MKSRNTALPLALFLLVAFVAPTHISAEDSLTFAGGSDGGTYIEIAKSFNKLPDFTVTAVNTHGSVENIQMVKNGKADLGIAQMDILANTFLYDSGAKSKVKILLPLYVEEVHLLARKSIKQVKQIKGKKVSIGPPNSGISGTARIVLGTLGLDDTKVTIDKSTTSIALKKLLSGDLDAMFVVAGAPHKLLASLPADSKKKIHMIKFTGTPYKLLTGGYFPYNKAELRQDVYAWLSGNVTTISVNSAVIVRADLDNKKVMLMVKQIFGNQGKLEKVHSKWKSLNKRIVNASLKGKPELFHGAVKSALRALD